MMTDMGEFHYYLGISVAYTLELHQKQHIEKMLKKYQLEDLEPVSSLTDPNVTLQMDDGVTKAMNLVVYQSMIESQLKAAVGTRPDISNTVGVVSRFSSKLVEAHLTALKNFYHSQLQES